MIKQTQRAKIAVPASHFMNLWQSSQSLNHRTIPIKMISSQAWFKLWQHPPAIFPLCIWTYLRDFLPQPTGSHQQVQWRKIYYPLLRPQEEVAREKVKVRPFGTSSSTSSTRTLNHLPTIKRYYPISSDFDPVSYVMEMKMTWEKKTKGQILQCNPPPHPSHSWFSLTALVNL